MDFRYECKSLHFVQYFSTSYFVNVDQVGWGIAWFINDSLVPELVVERGKTYTFIVEGGNNPSDTANYHPLYITGSAIGGRLLNTAAEQNVSEYC